MTNGLRAAVIGLGRMGMNHVRACCDTDGIDLVAVLDHKPDWAVKVGAETQSLVAADIESLFGKVDLAIVAVPTADHMATAVPLLQNGISCLVEKPIAASEPDTDAMITAAKSDGARLQVGHIERFNPALDGLIHHLGADPVIKRITAQRHNPPVDRAYDDDAVLDLMIHDLDLLTLLFCNEFDEVSVEDGATPHRVKTRLKFDGQTNVDLSVDREAATPVRDMIIETDDATFHLDFSTQSVSKQTPQGRELLPVQNGDALRRQLKAFASETKSASINGATGPEALAALRLANRVRAAAGLM